MIFKSSIVILKNLTVTTEIKMPTPIDKLKRKDKAFILLSYTKCISG